MGLRSRRAELPRLVLILALSFFSGPLLLHRRALTVSLPAPASGLGHLSRHGKNVLGDSDMEQDNHVPPSCHSQYSFSHWQCPL